MAPKMSAALLALACLLSFSANSQELDSLTKAVVAYELTLPHVESYADVLDDLVSWSKSHPEESKPLRDKNKRFTTLEDSASQLESIPGIKRILDKHHITGKDMALMPAALMSGIMVALGIKQGRTMPPDHFNAASVAMINANETRVNQLMQRITANLSLLSSKE